MNSTFANNTLFNNIYNSEILQKTYAATSDGLSTIYNGGIYNLPYNVVKVGIGSAAGTINYFAAPAVDAVYWSFNENNYSKATTAISTGIFVWIAREGYGMVKTPFSRKNATWIRIENRFQSKYELKTKMVNVSDLPDSSKVKVITDKKMSKVNALADAAKNAAKKAQDDAGPAQTKATQDMEAANKALEVANALKAIFDEAENSLIAHGKKIEGDLIPFFDEIDTSMALEDVVAIAKLKYEDAQKEADKLMATATAQQTKADELTQAIPVEKAKAEKAVKDAETLKKQFEKPKTTGLSENNPTDLQGTFALNAVVEKTKPKPGETHINIPMSNNAIIVNHENTKKDFLKCISGVHILTAGLLGVLGTVAEAEKAVFETNFTKTIAELTLGSDFSNFVWLIRKPVHFVTEHTGQVVSKALTYDTIGLSKLLAAAGLVNVSYKLFSGGVNFAGYSICKPVDGTWWDFKKANPAEPKVNKGIILHDIAKVTTAITLIGASILSVNSFINGMSK